MATAEQYAEWIVNNAHRRGTPEFDTVAQAYQLAKQEGLKAVPAPAPSKERTFGEAAQDIAAGVVSGAGSLVQLPGQLYGLATGDFSETGALGLGKDISKYGEEMKSAGLKAREAERAEKIKTAEQTGQWEAFKTAFGETIKDPALLTSFLAEQAPQLLVPFGAAKVAQIGTAAKAAAAAEGLVGKAAEKAVGEVTKAAAERGTRAAIGAGAVQQGADVGAQAYEDIYKELKRKGATDADAAQGAINLARAAGASGALISILAQRLPGARTLEESFAGVPGTGGRLLGAAKGALGEGASEIVEETGGKFGANLAMREVKPEQSLLEGLGQTAGMAAVGGVGMGGVTGLGRRHAAKETKLESEAPKAETSKEPQLLETESPKPVTGEAGIVRPEEEVKPLTSEEQRELELQQRLYRSQQPKAEELLGKVRGQIQTAPPTTPADIARIRDDHETAVINSLLEQDRKMQSVADLARLNLERMSHTESLEAATQDADRRVREGRLMARVQSLIDQNIPFASTAIADINRKFEMIGEAPLDDTERARVQNIMTMAQGFTDFVKLPSLPVREQDRFAENQAMEALIKERKPRGEVSPQPVRAEAPAPSPVVGKTPVSGRVEEGAAVRPEVSPEPSIAKDRQRAEPVVEAAAPEPVVTEAAAKPEEVPSAPEVVPQEEIARPVEPKLVQPKEPKTEIAEAPDTLTDEEFDQYEREQTQEAISRLSAGDYAAPRPATFVRSGMRSKVDEAMDRVAQNAYRKAVRKFLQSPLTAKPPTGRGEGIDYSIYDGIDSLTDVEPRRIETKAPVAKSFQNKLEVLFKHVVPSKDLRYYLTKVMLDPEKSRMVATDGKSLVIVEDDSVKQNAPERPLGVTRDKAILVNKDGTWATSDDGRPMEAIYPDVDRVIPKTDRTDAVSYNTDDFVAYAKGVEKSNKFVKTDLPLVIQIFNKQNAFDVERLVSLGEVFRRFGYKNFVVTLPNDPLDGRLMATSPDGKVKQIVMSVKYGETTGEIKRRFYKPYEPVAPKPSVAEGEGRAAVSDEEVKKSLRATPDQQVRDFEQTLRTALNKFGLKDVGVKLIDGMREEGSYAQQIIRIAADSANPIRTLRHEAIHALRELGFFTGAQWQSLSKMAKDKWIDQYLKQRNVDGKSLKAGEESRYDAYMREYEGDMEKITEEAVADAFADFDATKPPAGLVSSLLTRLRNLFQAIKSALTNVESPEQIFGKVERGELSKGKSLERTEELASLKYANDYVKRADQLDRAFTQMGLHVIRESSKASGSEYVEASDDEYQKTGGNNGKKLKFRISDHPLPLSYAQPDFDVLADADKKHANVSGNWMEAVEFAANYFNIEAPKLVTAARAKESLLNKRAKESAKTKLESIAQQEINNLQNWMNDQDVIIKRSSSKLQGYLEKNGKVIFTLIYAQGPNGKVPADKEQAIKNQISKLQSNLSGERKSLREQPYRGQVGKETPPTPTTAGQSALDTINQLGMGVKQPEGNLYEQAKKKFKAMGESPAGTKAEIKEAVRKFFANIETKTMSSDARWDSDIKNGLRQDMKPVEDIIGASLLASQSQAVGADAVSTRAMLIGGATYDEKAMKWVAYENKDANEVVKAKVLDEIAAKYGLTKEEASQVAHTYLVAANYEGIIKRNAKLEEQIKALKEEGKNDEADDLEAALVFVSENQAAMVEPGKSIAGTIPEVKKIAEIWNEQRRMVKDAMVFSGLWRPEYADAMMDNAAYVPFYRETQIDADEGPRIFMRGLQVKAKEHKLKGSETAVNNVFENMAMWQQYAMNRAIRNHKAVQSIDVGKTIQVGDRKMAEQVKEPKRGMNVVKIWREGKQEFYEVADPYYVEAFQTLGAVYIEPIKYFTAISNILRKTVVMYPLFSIGQITQDSVAAIFASGLKPQYAFKIPYLAVKEFGKTMMGWSTTHDELKNYGAVGVRDFNAAVAREDAAITAGVKAPRGAWGKVNYMLERVAMSADNAVRQAMYIAATEAKLSKAEALEKAFEIINFRRRGSSKMLQLMGQTVPFFYAYLSAQRVAYKTLTLSGISPTERMAALETLAQTTAAVMALSFIYAMANGDDEEYKKTPSTIRDRSLMIPGSGGVRIPLRPDFFLFPKVIAEHTYQLLTDEGYSDGAKMRKSMADLLANATLSPNAVPQIIKPTFEAAINYSFFEGKPIVGFFEQNKEAGRQFNDSTSEMAKWFGQFGASPQMVDHLIRGYFGSVGGLTLWGTNFFVEGEPGVPRPEITAHDMFVTMPGVGAFKQKPTENALKVDFYELRDAIAKVKNTYDDMKVRSPEGLEAFIQDEKNLARLAMDKQITKIGDHLSKIRRAIQQVAAAPESRMSANEKQERIKELRDVEMELLKAVDVKALRAQAKL